MARGKTADDLSTLQMALVGYEIERRRIEDKIREIQAQLKGKNVAISAGADGRKPGVKRVLSPAARKRIAAAQKKRWAEHHRRQAMAAKGE
jgi:hypothetical protein